jgi:16S rRNA (cytosine967-C5)-methyltransferase
MTTAPQEAELSAVNPGRLAAARALIAVEGGAHAEDILAAAAVPDRDRALAWTLALGVLRRRGVLDQAIGRHLRQPVEQLDPPLRAALRVGAWELAFGRARADAVVHQAVEVARASGGARGSGLVNAVLRRVAASPPEPTADPAVDLPPWLQARLGPWSEWLRRCQDPAPTCAVLRSAADAPPPGSLPAPPVAGGREVADAWLIPAEGGAIPGREGFAEGRWWVMDPAACAVADLAHEAAPGGAVLDACAAPGGKSFRLASRGHAVVAVDQSADRLGRVGEGARRLGLPVELQVHDWSTGPCPRIGKFPVVLVDAPCTGLGTIRRHPEIRWRRAPSDPAAMAVRQAQILEAAAAHVAPGGALVYAVCSPLAEEGAGVVSALRGWRVQAAWASAPPVGDEDAFQAFVLRGEEGRG